MFTLAFGRPPFESKDVKETYKKIKAVSYSFPEGTTVSNSFKSIISSILQKEPNKRPTLKEIKEHEFFRGSSLSRQTSILLKVQASTSNLVKLPSYKESNKELSDNGKLYTNNDLITSKEYGLRKDRSQDRFMQTERNGSCFKTPVKPQKIQRVKSQRVFK
jgi:polo-like kinase 1